MSDYLEAVLTIRVLLSIEPDSLNTEHRVTETHLKTYPEASIDGVWDAIQWAIAHENAEFCKYHRIKGTRP